MPIEDYLWESAHATPAHECELSQETLDTLWQLFCQIGVFWKNVPDSEPMKSRWIVFVQNRIRTNPAYAAVYREGAELLRTMIANEGETEAFAMLFTRAEATIAPPKTPLARLRQKVSNEFITLQLSLGGFRGFQAGNYLGYFGGSNIPGQPAPYRTAGGNNEE